MASKSKDKEVLEEKKETTKKKASSKSTAKKKTTSKTSSKAKTKTTTSKPKTKATKKTSSKTSSTSNAKGKKDLIEDLNIVKDTKKVENPSSAKIKLYKNVKDLLDKTINIAEYYDLPYSYNKTEVNLLAQTPNTLYLYWDINEDLINSFKSEFGEDFLETTKPYLKIYNETLNYSFEVEINDFANSWYLHINNPKCKYRVELFRKFNGLKPLQHNVTKEKNCESAKNLHSNCIYISSSNVIEAPNDHVLFENFGNKIVFKDVSSGISYIKELPVIKINNIEKLYNVFELYNLINTKSDVKDLTSSRFF